MDSFDKSVLGTQINADFADKKEKDLRYSAFTPALAGGARVSVPI
jgi:hypothetical protein